MNDQPEYITKQKYDQLKEELQHLKTVARKAIAEQLDYAKSLGDLSENAEYHEAREKQADTEDRINQLEFLLKKAEIIDEDNASHDKVSIGSQVTITKKADNSSLEITIAGSEEADINNNKISYQSPLGEAILNHKAGDTVIVHTPKGEVEYLIEHIK